jgi:hypothetical protein
MVPGRLQVLVHAKQERVGHRTEMVVGCAALTLPKATHWQVPGCKASAREPIHHLESEGPRHPGWYAKPQPLAPESCKIRI